MRPVTLAIALFLTPAAGFAQPEPDTTAFRNLAATIASDPRVAGQWSVLLPVIARQCDMAVDHERLALTVNGFADPDEVDEAADYFASGHAGSLREAWDAIATQDQDAACRLADSLWGDAGALAAGILRDRAAPAAVPERATDKIGQ